VEAARKNALGQKTAALLPRHSKARWPVALAVAAGVALALVSAYYVLRAMQIPERDKDLVEQKQDAPLAKPNPPLEPKRELAKTPTEPSDLEWNAFDASDDQERVRLYFQAGDLYLDRHNDIQAALRCYHQAIHYCDARALEFDPNDHWLVMALKRDQRKEK